jgi:hypothetical protein
MTYAGRCGRGLLRRWQWLPALVAFGLQSGVGLVAPAAHADVARGAGNLHVEAAGNPACPGGHNHLACQFCRAISAPALFESAPILSLQDREVARVAPDLSLLPIVVWPAPLGARGPPLA